MAVLACGLVHAGAPMTGYLMGYCTESPKGQGNSRALHLATSDDGLNWMPLNQNEPVLISDQPKKAMRDPSLIRKQDGGFVVLAADLSKDDGLSAPEIQVWETGDFITFHNARQLRLHDVPMHIRAPRAFFDVARKQYGIIWSGDSGHYRTYVNYTSDFAGVSPADVLFDPGHDVQDATLCCEPEHGGNFLYYRDAVANRLLGSRSASRLPGSFHSNRDLTALGGNHNEAPCIVKDLHDQRWILYGESNGECRAWQTDDIAKDDWHEIDSCDYNLPLNANHASVIPLTRLEMDHLIDHWGQPKWNRLKSYNIPYGLLRHEDWRGRISTYPFDPYQDSQWRIVPGLADPRGVSFEAVNYPGYFLRSVAEHVMLSKDDGSSFYKAKATFAKVAGLATRRGSSFRSWDSPELYLRHANSFLRLEALKSPADREDATFLLGY